jgi:hypothetical protein
MGKGMNLSLNIGEKNREPRTKANGQWTTDN